MATDEQRAFWAAIRAQPDDDTPRLVYADWLQEHGDEARAEFIRIQCQISRLPDDRKTLRKVLPALVHRERLLLTANRVRWVEPVFRAVVRSGPGARLESWAGTTSFVRGFISQRQLDLDGAHRLVTADPELEPLQDVAVVQGWEKYNPKKLVQLFAWEGVSCITRLSFTGANDDCMSSIVSSTATRLTHLMLNLGEITDSGVTLLSEWPYCAGLVSLKLSSNRIGDRGAAALAESPNLNALAELNLERNPIGREGRRRLTSRFGGSVILPSDPV